mmetsp:Transcript_18406/g.44335  ORF Transcript_18406/g.44335 Transcript_18406/m.44335 type:complete len:214 (+) Transcript_18406:2574-3215(+)
MLEGLVQGARSGVGNPRAPCWRCFSVGWGRFAMTNLQLVGVRFVAGAGTVVVAAFAIVVVVIAQVDQFLRYSRFRPSLPPFIFLLRDFLGTTFVKFVRTTIIFNFLRITDPVQTIIITNSFTRGKGPRFVVAWILLLLHSLLYGPVLRWFVFFDRVGNFVAHPNQNSCQYLTLLAGAIQAALFGFLAQLGHRELLEPFPRSFDLPCDETRVRR